MKTISAYGLQLWQDLAELFNKNIEYQGSLKIDMRDLWDGLFHRWTNEDWLLVISVAERLIDFHPNLAQVGHRAIIEEAKKHLFQHYRNEHRVLDQRRPGMDFKRVAWRLACSLREIWNTAQNIDLPVQVRTRSFRRTTIWKPR